MGIEEAGARAQTLTDTLDVTSGIYTFARNAGLTAVTLLNTSDTYPNVTQKKIKSLMNRIVFEGLTNLGTKLREKILDVHVKPDMKKPLLVIVLSDAEVMHPSPKV